MDQGSTYSPDSQIAILPRGRHRDSHDPRAPGPEPRLTLSRSRWPAVIAFAVALVALFFWFLTTRSEPAALRRLPVGTRAALVQRTLANLRDVCKAGDRPREFCKEEATLLLALPECGQECQAQARQELLADSAVK